MTCGPSLAESFELVGTVAVVDLEAACALYGVDVLPYPLGRSRPVGSVWLATRDVAPIEERLRSDDLRGVREWVEAVVRSDVCIECRVHRFDEDTTDRRLHGMWAGESGFVAVQSADSDGVDIVDIYAVSPTMVGPAIAEAVGLVGAGAHLRIAVTGGGDHLPESPDVVDEYDDLGLTVTHFQPTETAVTVDSRDVVATGTVQSRHEPARHWGADPARPMLQWVQVRGDGDYLYEANDSGYLEPLDLSLLSACIEELIADVTRW